MPKLEKGFPIISLAEMVKRALDEVFDDYPELVETPNLGSMVAEALVTSPHLFFVSGNIWSDVDDTDERVRN